ncbi:hypothetical protein ACSSV1_005890 [Labrenzia sp. MBR-25]|jgi:hypothetical protein
MAKRSGVLNRWQNYRPSKFVWFASCVFCVLTTVGFGFTYGGWVTTGTAENMIRNARFEAREEVLASMCVDKFIAARNAKQNLQELKSVHTTQRDDYIANGGWADIASSRTGIFGVVDLCADKLIAMDRIPPREVDPIAEFLTTTPLDG